MLQNKFIKLKSAVPFIGDDNVKYVTAVGKEKKMVDYILYSHHKKGIECLEYLEPPIFLGTGKRHDGPNELFASDHVCLAAKFGLYS